MKTRVALAGFGPAVAAALDDQGIAPVGHVYTGRPQGTDSTAIIAFERFKLMDVPALDGRVPAPPPPPDVMEMFIRCVDRWDWSRERVHSHACYHDLYAIAHAQAEKWLNATVPDLLVFSNVPHQGALIALHQAATLRGIPCRICLQSPFGANHFCLPHWSHLGRLEAKTGRPEDHPLPAISTDPPQAPPFYMKSVRGKFEQKLRTGARQTWSATRYAAATLANFGPSRAGQRRRLLNRMLREIDNARYMDLAERAFSATATSLAGKPYVYFPLHLQPEMTTDILGGDYADQLQAIEELRRRIPAGLPIAVKENPKQRGYMRSDAFFTRLRSIPGLVLLKSSEPSFELAANATAVATICGTAGWEALRMGKPAICFGHAFWNRMHGAFRIQDEWDWEDVAGHQFDRHALERDAARLAETLMPGYSDLHYAGADPSHDGQQNARTLAHVIVHLAHEQE